MALMPKARESLLRALNSPRAVTTEAAPSLPQSVAAKLAGFFKAMQGKAPLDMSCIFRPQLLAHILKAALPGSLNLPSTYFFGLRNLHVRAVATTAGGGVVEAFNGPLHGFPQSAAAQLLVL